MFSAEERENWSAVFERKFAKKQTANQPEPEPETPVEIEEEELESAVAEAVAEEIEKEAVPEPEDVQPAEDPPKEPEETVVAVKKAKKKPAREKAEEPYVPKELLRVIKNIKKDSDSEHNPSLGKIFKSEGWKCCIDGQRILRTMYPGIELETEEELFKTEMLFKDVYEYSRDWHDVKCPSLAELKELDKKARAEYKESNGKLPGGARVVYVFENGLTMNIKFLMEGILATDSEVFLYKNNKSPIYFCEMGGGTEYLALPVNPKEGTPAGARVIA